jgi:hypothetical protein
MATRKRDHEIQAGIRAIGKLSRHRYTNFHLSQRHTMLLFATMGSTWFALSLTASIVLKSIYPAYKDGQLGNWIMVVPVITCIWPAIICTRTVNHRMTKRHLNKYEEEINDSVDKNDRQRFDDVIRDLDIFLSTHYGSMGRVALFGIGAMVLSDPNSILTRDPERMKKKMEDFFRGLRNTDSSIE